MAWIYLMIAALFEICWTYSLKFLSIKKIKAIPWLHFFNNKENALTLCPLLGYIVFGLCNILFFSMAMKQIPAATALAVWMGMTLVGVKLLDIGLFKQPYDLYQFFYIALIIIGIVGLKRS